MKKIITLFAIVGLMSLQSCTTNDDPNDYIDYDTISEVFDVSNVNFTNANDYSTLIDLNPSIFNTDVILVYRSAIASNGQRVWKILPETYYYDDGTMNFAYNYNFTVNDISIYMDGFDLGSVVSENRLNQIFRIVIVPGSSTGSAKSVVKEDYSDYNAVVKKYNIDDSNVKQIKQ